MNNSTRLIDLVMGIEGVFDHKEEAPGKEFRYIIYYKEATPIGVLKKPKRLPMAISPQAITEVPGSRRADGKPCMYIVSYGNDSLHPPLLKELIDKNFSEMITSMERMSVDTERREESLRAEQRILDRSKAEEVRKTAESVSVLKGDQKKKTISGGLGDLSDMEG